MSHLTITTFTGDLFSLSSPNSPIVHCISADGKLGAGFAAIVAKRFDGIRSYVKSKNPKVGELVEFEAEDQVERSSKKKRERLVLNMITKDCFYQKPKEESFSKALSSLKAYCESEGIRKLVMPKIGCGLDKLNWENFVLPEIKKVFKDMDMTIEVYCL